MCTYLCWTSRFCEAAPVVEERRPYTGMLWHFTCVASASGYGTLWFDVHPGVLIYLGWRNIQKRRNSGGYRNKQSSAAEEATETSKALFVCPWASLSRSEKLLHPSLGSTALNGRKSIRQAPPLLLPSGKGVVISTFVASPFWCVAVFQPSGICLRLPDGVRQHWNL